MIQCPVCENITKPCFKRKSDEVVECGNCQLRFAWPQPTDEELARRYTSGYYGEVRTRYQETDGILYNQVIRYILEKTNSLKPALLDYGCAKGGLWQELPSDLKQMYIGIEKNDKARREASEITNRPIFSSINELAQKGEVTWDICIMNQVVEHCVDPLYELGFLNGTGAKDAILFIATPNIQSAKALLLGRKWSQYQNDTHLFFHAFRSCKEMLLKAGFSEVQRCNFQIDYPDMGIGRRICQRILRRLGIDGNLTVIAKTGK